jgi:hypothetical protein
MTLIMEKRSRPLLLLSLTSHLSAARTDTTGLQAPGIRVGTHQFLSDGPRIHPSSRPARFLQSFARHEIHNHQLPLRIPYPHEPAPLNAMQTTRREDKSARNCRRASRRSVHKTSMLSITRLSESDGYKEKYRPRFITRRRQGWNGMSITMTEDITQLSTPQCSRIILLAVSACSSR